MQELQNWSNVFYTSLQSFGQKLMGAIPQILGALAILLIGWLAAKIVSSGIKKVLELAHFNKLAEKVNASEYLEKANIQTKPSGIISKFVYWILMLLVITTASDSLGWSVVSMEIAKLMTYLPNLLIAIVIFIVGTTIAKVVAEVIKGATSSMGIGAGKMVSEFVYYLLFIVVTLTALGQAGVDTSIITSNLFMILGAILATASISYGIASKQVLANILASYFNKSSFKVGETIEMGSIKGEIVEINSMSVVLKTKDNYISIPSSKIIDETIILTRNATD
ncbi:MAG: small-conductance mechanosensitive channel [Arcticibacterium sp.]|jgi:small-conductance mechanosensitive channel